MKDKPDSLDAALRSLAAVRRDLHDLAAALADDLTEVRAALADLERRQEPRS